MIDIIDEAVESGMYRSRADYIMAALRDFNTDTDYPSDRSKSEESGRT